MTQAKKPNPLVEVLKNAQRNPKVPVATTAKIQQAKMRTQTTTNRPTKKAVGRGG